MEAAVIGVEVVDVPLELRAGGSFLVVFAVIDVNGQHVLLAALLEPCRRCPRCAAMTLFSDKSTDLPLRKISPVRRMLPLSNSRNTF